LTDFFKASSDLEFIVGDEGGDDEILGRLTTEAEVAGFVDVNLHDQRSEVQIYK